MLNASTYCSLTTINDLDVITIAHPLFDAEVTYQGAQLFKFSAKNAFSLFCSDKALFKKGKAIRGGIPLCWPWFGPKEGSISHGFARIAQWELITIQEDALHVELVWKLHANEETKKYWPYLFELTLTQTLSHSIDISLHVDNIDTKSFEITEAFHTYFAVDNLENLHVKSLENHNYYNQLTCRDEIEKSIVFDKEIDRIYQHTFSTIVIDNNNKDITLSQENCNSVILWNPYIEKAISLKDMRDDEYKQMLCIESANVKEESIIVKEGERHSIKLRIS